MEEIASIIVITINTYIVLVEINFIITNYCINYFKYYCCKYFIIGANKIDLFIFGAFIKMITIRIIAITIIMCVLYFFVF